MDDPTLTRRGGRGPRPDPHHRADLRQLADSPVSLRRIARLLAPFKGRLAVVVGLIVASAGVGLAQPFLVRGLIDDALPRQDVSLLLWLVGAMVAVATTTALIGVLQTWLLDRRGSARDARPPHRAVRPPAAPVDRVLHPGPRWRGAVTADQRHQRRPERRDVHRDLDRLQRHRRRRHRRRHGRPVVAAVPALAARAAAGHLAHPPGGPPASQDHRRAAAAPGATSTCRSRRRCRSAARS